MIKKTKNILNRRPQVVLEYDVVEYTWIRYCFYFNVFDWFFSFSKATIVISETLNFLCEKKLNLYQEEKNYLNKTKSVTFCYSKSLFINKSCLNV